MDIAEGSRRLERALELALARQVRATGANVDAAPASGDQDAAGAADAAGRPAATPSADAPVPVRLPTNPWTYDPQHQQKPRHTRAPG